MTHFVVSRLNWRESWDKVWLRAPGQVRVSAFATFDEAEADGRVREEAARRNLNPFRFGTTWGERSPLPEPVFRDFIKDAGIEPPTLVPVPTHDENGEPLSRQVQRQKEREAPPAGTFRDWASWWDATASSLAPEQFARVWEGLSRVRFFAVEEREVRTVAFAVVQIDWNYNDEWYYPPHEGGTVYTAYRSREKAEAACANLNAELREQWRRRLHLPEPGAPVVGVAGYEAYPFDMQNRPFPGDDPLGPRRKPPERENIRTNFGKFGVDEVPFYEVIEFELAEGQ